MKTFLQFIAEVNQRDISNIGKKLTYYRKNKLKNQPLNDLFDGKARIVIPIIEDPKEQEFFNYLEENGLTNIDFKTGMGEKEVETQKGKKKQIIKIGKFIQSIKDDKSKEFLYYYETNKVRLSKKQEDKNKGVSIVISRNPIDILRMSDHSEWKSCHSPGGSFYKCAFQEAKKGGAIAYVVRNSELEKLDNLQANEIFKDDDRDIDGIEPLQRLRLRRFVDDDEDKEYLVPELRKYGISHDGFYNTVKNWALTKQKDRLEKLKNQYLRPTGGTYFDNDPSELWSEFIGRDVNVDDVDESNSLTQDQVNEVVAGHRYRRFRIQANVEGNVVDYYALFQFAFPIDNVEKEYRVPNSIYGRLQNNLEQLISEATGWETVDLMRPGWDNKALHFDFRLIHEGTNGTIESLEQFLDEIDGYDREYDHCFKKVKLLLEDEFILINKMSELELNNLTYISRDERTDHDDDYMFSSETFDIGELKGLPKEEFTMYNDNLYISHGGNSEDLATIMQQSIIYGQLRTFIIDSENNHYGIHPTQNKNSLYEKGKIEGRIVVYADSDADDKKAIQYVEMADKEVPEAIKKVQVKWNEIYRTNYGKRNNYNLKRIQDMILKHYKTGEVYIKNEDYYFRDPEANIDMLASSFLNRLEVWSEDMSRRVGYRRNGNFVFKIHNGDPVVYWEDYNKKTIEPVKV